MSLNATRIDPTDVPQSTVKSPRPVKHVVNKEHSPIRRTINHTPATKNSNKGNPQQALKDKGVIKSGCSRHMTRKGYFLLDFKEINEGYVAFGGNPKGDSECVVLCFEFKLSDENHVLLMVPKENNMYNVDLKNVVPSGDLTCLFAKATLDEFNLWQRRLGHVNFKTMNKLVKCNLVRGIKREFSIARTPQQNRVVERKNRIIIEAARTKLADSLSPSLGFIRPFGCPVTILNTLDPRGKFDGKADEGFSVGYAVNRIGPKWLFDIDTLTKSINYQPVVARNQPNDNVGIKEILNVGKDGKETVFAQQYVLLPLWSTGSQDPQNTDNDDAFDVKENENDVHVSANGSDKSYSKKHDEKVKRDDKGKSHVDSPIGVSDLRAEFEEFSSNSTNRVNAVSSPVTAAWPNLTNSTNNFTTASPSDTAVSPNFRIARKSSFVDLSKYPDDPDMPELEDIVFRNKKDERGIVIKNKARLVTQGHTQEEGIDYDEVLAPVARIEAIRLFLAYHVFMGFMVYQMDVKKAFLYRTIEEEVYVCQALGFEDPDYPDKDEFQMSSMGELTFFLGLQVKQKDDGIFISQDKYVAKILRKFGFIDFKSASTHIETEKPLLKDPDGENVDVHIYRYLKGKPHLGLWYLRDSHFNLVAYSNSDYVGASLDKKSTTRGCQFLGCRLIYWQCKKQIVVATSSTVVEYIATASCCAQVLWIQNQLLDYGHYITAVSHKLMLFGLTKVAAVNLMLLDFKEFTLRDYYCWLKTYYCWYKLKLLDNAADSRLRLLEQSAAADDKMKK
nr:copia protein [Tanacetum cinerariifolium]